MRNAVRNLLLVVDDTESSRYVHARALRMAGFDTIEAGTGEQGLALAKRERPELVLASIVSKPAIRSARA